MTTRKEIRERLVENLRKWQKIEDASVSWTAQIMEQTDNPLIRLVMQIIHSDSQTHRMVQQFIVDSFEKEAIRLAPEEVAKIWESVARHGEAEKKMIEDITASLAEIRKQKLPVQEYLLGFLLEDEKKHDELLGGLEKVKGGLYPYA